MRANKVFFGLIFLVIATAFMSCEKDTKESTSGSIAVGDQTLSQNTVIVNTATISKGKAWVVIHDNSNGKANLKKAISSAKLVSEGSTDNIKIELLSMTPYRDGDTLFARLYTDANDDGKFVAKDDPYVGGTEKSFRIYKPYVKANDQVIQNDQIVLDEVKAAVDGWIVIHKDNGLQAPGDDIGHIAIKAGIIKNLIVAVPASGLKAGDLVFPMIHIDAGDKNVYQFPGADAPEIFGFGSPNNVFSSFKVQ